MPTLTSTKTSRTPPAAEHLVRQQQVVPEPGGGHPFDLAGRRAAERAVPRRGELPGQGGGLEGLDVRPQARTGQGGGHRRHVVVERLAVDNQRGRGNIPELHPGDAVRYGPRRRTPPATTASAERTAVAADTRDRVPAVGIEPPPPTFLSPSPPP